MSQRGKTSQLISITIEPGGQATRPVFGRYLYVVECSAPFLWRMDQTPLVPADQGSRLKAAEDATFEQVQFVNPQIVSITVKVFVGFAEYDQARFAIIEPTTTLRAQAGSLAGATGIDLTPTLSAGEVRRKALTVSNGSATDRLQIRDASGNVALIIFPETSIILPISEACELYNPNPGAVDYSIGQIIWNTAS